MKKKKISLLHSIKHYTLWFDLRSQRLKPEGSTFVTCHQRLPDNYSLAISRGVGWYRPQNNTPNSFKPLLFDW